MSEDLYRKRRALQPKRGDPFMTRLHYPHLIIVHRSIPDLSFKIEEKVYFPSIGRNRCQKIYIKKEVRFSLKEGFHSWLDYCYPLLIIVHMSIPGLSFKFDWKVSFPSIGRNRSRGIYIDKRKALLSKRGDPFMTRLPLSTSYNRP